MREERKVRKEGKIHSYLMAPNDLVHARVGLDGTLKVHVITFLDVAQV